MFVFQKNLPVTTEAIKLHLIRQITSLNYAARLVKLEQVLKVSCVKSNEVLKN